MAELPEHRDASRVNVGSALENQPSSITFVGGGAGRVHESHTEAYAQLQVFAASDANNGSGHGSLLDQRPCYTSESSGY